MTRSLCSSTTVFYSTELLLSLLALYFLFWQPSSQCLTSHHDSAIHRCALNSTELARSLAQSLFNPSVQHEDMRSVMEPRLGAVESVSCQELNLADFNWNDGPKYSIFYLAVFFATNGLLCLVMFLRRRFGKLGSLFYHLESILVAVITTATLSVIVYFENRYHKLLTVLPADLPGGIELQAPGNWIKANLVAVMTLVCKLAQIVFQACVGEKKIEMQSPIFKFFDFSKTYTMPEESK